ncbi:MAG: MFS transporter [Candidatus Andersenbacteria bacterium]|nr:MFS transporter [Candidatus Andersenbacteria bacterium]
MATWRPGALSNMFSVNLKPEMKELYLPLGAKFAATFGFERSLTFSLPIFVVYFITLAAVPEYPGLFWLALVLLTLHKVFYWPAYHAALAKQGDGHNRGTELSWLTVLRYGVGVAGPLLGGLIATFFGFQVLFLLTALTVLASAGPLLKTREHYTRMVFSYWAPWKTIFQKRNRGMVLAMFGMGENLVDLVYWPIFMFIILGSADKVGFFTAITTAIMAAIGFMVGEMADRFSRRTLLRLYLPFMAVGYLFRPLALTPIAMILTDTLNKLSYIGVNLPMVYRLYEQARGVGYLKYATAFEMVLAVAKAITALFLVWLFAVTLPYTALTITFILSAFLALFYAFL